jgi:TIR domain
MHENIEQLIQENEVEEALLQLSKLNAEAGAQLTIFRNAEHEYSLNGISFDAWQMQLLKSSRAALKILEAVRLQNEEKLGYTQAKENMTTKSKTSIRIFLSYSHEDESLKTELDNHLAPLKRNGKIETWNDRKLEAGQEWDPLIKAKIAEADIILLLVSPGFNASDYIWKYEIEEAMHRHEKGEAVVIPVFLKPCIFSEMPYAKIQGLPKDAKFVTKFNNQDDAFFEIASGIKRVVDRILTQRE